VVENCLLRDANRCDAEETAGLGVDMRRLDSRAIEAMDGVDVNRGTTLSDLQLAALEVLYEHLEIRSMS
jgi:hypothetical protein